MDTNKNITLVIADDHTFFREGLSKVLEANNKIKVLAQATNGLELIDIAKQYNPDVLIVDIAMPLLDGIQAVKEITRLGIRSKVIALSMHTEDSIILQMLDAGAMGFLDKNTSKEEMYEAIDSVFIHNSVYFPESTNAYIMELLRSSTYKPYPQKGVVFTPRELEVIQMICKDFTTKEIGAKLDLSHRTIDTHRVRIMDKMSVKSVAGLVAYAYSQGILNNS
jgi:DNA-binding NarL/FixJ family response regulator